MRKILFRGKRTSDNGWSYGNLVVDKQGVAIITPDETVLGKYGEVIPETVGQYTGLTDKNGKKIFEGDILSWQADGYTAYVLVSYKDAAWVINAEFDELELLSECFTLPEIKVCGNVHNNPELLEGMKGL